MQTRADELVDQWHNGNHSLVVTEIIAGNSIRAALLSALIFSQLGTGERTVFLGLLNSKL